MERYDAQNPPFICKTCAKPCGEAHTLLIHSVLAHDKEFVMQLYMDLVQVLSFGAPNNTPQLQDQIGNDPKFYDSLADIIAATIENGKFYSYIVKENNVLIVSFFF